VSDRDPYRDERESLRAENERLRGDLARAHHRGRAVHVAAGLFGHVIVRQLVGSWLNGDDDTRFWLGVVIAVVPLVYALVALVQLLRPAPPPG